jgi:hypothetical protein
MTSDERFERIEKTLQIVADGFVANQSLLTSVIGSQARTHEMVADLVESVEQYVDAADARMKRIEVNLDGLIRAITAEYTNGKSKS